MLETVQGLGLLAIAIAFIRHHDPVEQDAAIAAAVGVIAPSVHRSIATRAGEIYECELCRRGEARCGAVSATLGETRDTLWTRSSRS